MKCEQQSENMKGEECGMHSVLTEKGNSHIHIAEVWLLARNQSILPLRRDCTAPLCPHTLHHRKLSDHLKFSLVILGISRRFAHKYATPEMSDTSYLPILLSKLKQCCMRGTFLLFQGNKSSSVQFRHISGLACHCNTIVWKKEHCNLQKIYIYKP